MPSLETKAMKPQPVFGAVQVFDMQQELILRFLFHGLDAQRVTRLVQEQAGHVQGIIPQLLFIDIIGGDVLQTALLGAGHLRHDPLAPFLDHGTVSFVAGFFIQQGHA